MADPLLWTALSALEPRATAERTGSRFADTGNFEIDLFNRVYAIDPALRKICRIDAPVCGAHEGRLEIPLLKYLTDATDVPEAGVWVSPRDLPGGAQFFTGVHEVPVGKIIAAFGADCNCFCKACESLGGTRVPFGDAGYVLRLFPRIPVQALLWCGDDEFPARASMLVDKNAYLHLPLDAMLAALGFLQYSIVSALAPVR